MLKFQNLLEHCNNCYIITLKNTNNLQIFLKQKKALNKGSPFILE